MPVVWLLFAVGATAIVGLPPLNGFVSEWLLYRGLLEAGQSPGSIRLAVLGAPALALVGGLALACFAKVAGVVFLGTGRSSRAVEASEPNAWLRGPAIVIALACAAIGIAPPLVIPPVLRAAGYVESAALDLDSTADLTGSAWQVARFALLLLFAIGIAALLMRWLRARVARRELDTWACGYTASTPRMQYTASSFAAPLLEVFGAASAVRAHRGATVFHSEPFDLVLDRAVAPVWAMVQRIGVRLRGLQQGRLRTYLVYVVATLTMLLAYLVVRGGAGGGTR
jgi:hydrogenase-4 component B